MAWFEVIDSSDNLKEECEGFSNIIVLERIFFNLKDSYKRLYSIVSQDMSMCFKMSSPIYGSVQDVRALKAGFGLLQYNRDVIFEIS